MLPRRAVPRRLGGSGGSAHSSGGSAQRPLAGALQLLGAAAGRDAPQKSHPLRRFPSLLLLPSRPCGSGLKGHGGERGCAARPPSLSSSPARPARDRAPHPDPQPGFPRCAPTFFPATHPTPAPRARLLPCRAMREFGSKFTFCRPPVGIAPKSSRALWGEGAAGDKLPSQPPPSPPSPLLCSCGDFLAPRCQRGGGASSVGFDFSLSSSSPPRSWGLPASAFACRRALYWRSCQADPIPLSGKVFVGQKGVSVSLGLPQAFPNRAPLLLSPMKFLRMGYSSNTHVSTYISLPPATITQGPLVVDGVEVQAGSFLGFATG